MPSSNHIYSYTSHSENVPVHVLCRNTPGDAMRSLFSREVLCISPSMILHVRMSRDRIELPSNAIRVIEADVPVMSLRVFLNPIVAYSCRV